MKKKTLMSVLLIFTIILTGCSIQQRDIVDTSLLEQQEAVEVDMTLISPIEE